MRDFMAMSKDKSQRRPQGQTVLTFKLVAPEDEVLNNLTGKESAENEPTHKSGSFGLSS